MFEHGLVFRDKTLVNYCPSCKVVLSNEDSQGGHCDICHSEIVQKTKEVWYLRITEYADKLFATENRRFGPEETAAVRLAQQRAGLLVTGTVDRGTWAALQAQSCPHCSKEE